MMSGSDIFLFRGIWADSVVKAAVLTNLGLVPDFGWRPRTTVT